MKLAWWTHKRHHTGKETQGLKHICVWKWILLKIGVQFVMSWYIGTAAYMDPYVSYTLGWELKGKISYFKTEKVNLIHAFHQSNGQAGTSEQSWPIYPSRFQPVKTENCRLVSRKHMGLFQCRLLRIQQTRNRSPVASLDAWCGDVNCPKVMH